MKETTSFPDFNKNESTAREYIEVQINSNKLHEIVKDIYLKIKIRDQILIHLGQSTVTCFGKIDNLEQSNETTELIRTIQIRNAACYSRDLIDMGNEDEKKIVTGDETWCFLNDPQTKRKSRDWKAKTSLRKEKLRLDKIRG
ncbi:hypothetical protein TNCV_3370981 [Trichonephila clavipes]|nr:hypothetical protein TNCV_3370981 [Trichonephila clavipes]